MKKQLLSYAAESVLIGMGFLFSGIIMLLYLLLLIPIYLLDNFIHARGWDKKQQRTR